MTSNIRRGEVYIADLGKPYGPEPGKQRPVVVIQADAVNEQDLDLVTVCLVTTRLQLEANIFRVQLDVGMGGVGKPSSVMVDQIKTIAVIRLRGKIGTLSNPVLSQVDRGLKALLDL